MANYHTDLTKKLAGKSYNSIREVLESLAWIDLYPEVDINGCLTGGVIELDSMGDDYAICDVTDDDIVVRPDGASMDAAIRWDSERGDIYGS